MKKQVSTKIGTVTPSIKGDWQFANLHECLPDYVCESLLEGMKAFGRKIKGYDAEDAVFSGVETRTSSRFAWKEIRSLKVISKDFSHVEKEQVMPEESLLQQWMVLKLRKPLQRRFSHRIKYSQQ